MTGVQDCILLVTSRPWKFYSLPEEDQKIFSTMELDGIKDNEELIKVILTKLEEPDPAKSCSDFKAQMKDNNMTEIMKSPLMLIFAIDIWESERSLPKSICINYIKIIESFVCRYQTKREEVITENTEVCVKKLKMDKYSESAKLLPNILSNYEFVQMHAGLFLSLGHLASDFLLGQEKQSLVFQKEACKRYNIKDNDGSLKLCLDIGILTKLESTMRGIKRTESFQFCHKTFQEFFAALWLSRKYTKEDSQERLTLHSRIETKDDVLNHGVLIQFMCGLNPELGSDFWKYISQENIIQYQYPTHLFLVQNLILKAVKEAHYCCDTQREQLYYCISYVGIYADTSDEDVSLLCKMIQSNSTNLKSLEMIFPEQMRLSYSQYHSLLSSISCATNLTTLTLPSISCRKNVSSDCLPVLYLHKHHKLRQLELDNISISGLLLPSQGESELSILFLDNLVLSHDNLVQLCTSLSSLSSLEELVLQNLSCSDDGGSCRISVLDLHKHHKLKRLDLDKISISSLVLPSQRESELSILYLYNLVLSHDNLVQLCSSLSSLSSLQDLGLTNLSCSDDGGSCRLIVLDPHKHHKLETLTLDKISISSLVLPSQGESELSKLYLYNLVVSHDNLVQLSSSLSNLTSLWELNLTNISCSDDSSSCDLPVLDLHRYNRLSKLSLNSISISGLLLPSQEKSQLCKLFLYSLVLSHDNLVQLYTSLSCVTTYLEMLDLTNLTCSDHNGRCHLLLDLHRHDNLSRLRLDKISLSVLYPSQEESKFRYLALNNMLLSHDSLVQLCSSISSLSALERLRLTNLRCYDHGSSGDIPILEFPKPELEYVFLEQIPVEDLQALSGLEDLQVTIMPYSEQSGECKFTVLDLHKHYKLEFLELDTSSISGMILPRQERLRFKRLVIKNLVLSHYSLEQLCASLSSLIALNVKLHFTKLSCRDHDYGFCFPLLNQPDTDLNVTDTDTEMDSSDDDSDSDDSDSHDQTRYVS